MKSKEEELQQLMKEKQEHILNEIRELSILANKLNELKHQKVLKKINGKNI